MASEIGIDIDKCEALLKKGEVVAIPTETVYGLAANGLNQNAVAHIFEVKNRPFFDPLILHSDSLEKVETFVEHIPQQAKILMENFWPGPITIVLPKRKIVPDIVTSGLPTVGVRIPAHLLTLKLLKRLPFPLAAPSANPFKYISPTTAKHVKEQLGDKIPYILDGGKCDIGLESTIIGFENGMPVIYRLGGLEIEKIQGLIGDVEIKENNEINPAAPGMLKLHYSPRTKLVIDDLNNLSQYSGQKVGVISFYSEIPNVTKCFVLSYQRDLKEAANNLFAVMRELDSMSMDIIIAEKFPDEGLGKAINDRLIRASAK